MAAAATGGPTFHSFITGLRTDQTLVTSGLSLLLNSSPGEGRINRTKMLRRQHT